MFSEAATNSLKILAERVRDAQGLVALATVAQRSPEQPDRSPGFQPGDAGTPKKFLKAWRQWEIDTNRKIDAGKKQWDDKIKTFLVSKQNWQEEIKSAAMEQSLEKMLGATGSALNDRLRTLSSNIQIPVDVPEINITDLVASAMADFDRNKPSSERIFGEINKSISAFNTTLELGNATHFKGFNSTTLESDFASNMSEFSKHMAILNNVKLYESMKKMIEDFKDSLRKNDENVKTGLTTAATLANYKQDGGWYTKDMGWAFGGIYSFSAYQHADVDAMMNRGMREAGMTIMSGEEMVNFLQNGRDVDVKLFFEVQTMALEQAFKIVGGDKGKKGLYGEWVGEAPQYNSDGDESNQGFGELGGWTGGQMDNKKTYRGLNKEEKRLSTIQGSWTTALKVTGAIAGAATGSLAFTLAMQGADQVAMIGSAAASGKDVSGMIAMGAIQIGLSAVGGFLGNYTYGMGEFADKAIGIAAKQAVSYAGSGFKVNAQGQLGYEGPSKGAGLNALTSTAFAIGGAGFNTGFNLSGATADLGSGMISAIGSGIRFNDNGTLQQDYDWKSAGIGMATSGVSAVTGGLMKGAGVTNQLLGNEITRALTTATTAAITGNSGVWNSTYSSNNMFNSLGNLLGDQIATSVKRGQNNEPYRDPVGDAAGKAAGGAAAFVATRLGRKEEDEYGIGMSQGFDPLGDALAPAGAAVGGVVGAIGRGVDWAVGGVLNGVASVAGSIGNFFGNAYSTVKDAFSSPRTVDSTANLQANATTLPREHSVINDEITRMQRNMGLTTTDAPINYVSAYPDTEKRSLEFDGLLADGSGAPVTTKNADGKEEKNIFQKIGAGFLTAADWIGEKIVDGAKATWGAMKWVGNGSVEIGKAIGNGIGTAAQWTGDQMMKAGNALFGENPNILGKFGDAWSKAGILGKIGLALASPVAYAAHTAYNMTAMVGSSLLQQGSPLDFTWGAVGTASGLVWGTANILAGGQVASKNGTAQFQDAPLMPAGFGVSLGPTIFGGQGFGGDANWGHEFGHSQQNRILGPMYLPMIMIPSGISAGFVNTPAEHENFYSETWATSWGSSEYIRRKNKLANVGP